MIVVEIGSDCDVFFFKRKTAYEMRISDWSSDVCSPDLAKFLLSSPQNPALEELARRNKRDDLSYRSRVKESIREIFKRATEAGVDFEVRLYTSTKKSRCPISGSCLSTTGCASSASCSGARARGWTTRSSC